MCFFLGTDSGLFAWRKREVLIETLGFLGILFLSALGSKAFLLQIMRCGQLLKPESSCL